MDKGHSDNGALVVTSVDLDKKWGALPPINGTPSGELKPSIIGKVEKYKETEQHIKQGILEELAEKIQADNASYSHILPKKKKKTKQLMIENSIPKSAGRAAFLKQMKEVARWMANTDSILNKPLFEALIKTFNSVKCVQLDAPSKHPIKNTASKNKRQNFFAIIDLHAKGRDLHHPLEADQNGIAFCEENGVKYISTDVGNLPAKILTAEDIENLPRGLRRRLANVFDRTDDDLKQLRPKHEIPPGQPLGEPDDTPPVNSSDAGNDDPEYQKIELTDSLDSKTVPLIQDAFTAAEEKQKQHEKHRLSIKERHDELVKTLLQMQKAAQVATRRASRPYDKAFKAAKAVAKRDDQIGKIVHHWELPKLLERLERAEAEAAEARKPAIETFYAAQTANAFFKRAAKELSHFNSTYGFTNQDAIAKAVTVSERLAKDVFKAPIANPSLKQIADELTLFNFIHGFKNKPEKKLSVAKPPAKQKQQPSPEIPFQNTPNPHKRKKAEQYKRRVEAAARNKRWRELEEAFKHLDAWLASRNSRMSESCRAPDSPTACSTSSPQSVSITTIPRPPENICIRFTKEPHTAHARRQLKASTDPRLAERRWRHKIHQLRQDNHPAISPRPR